MNAGVFKGDNAEKEVIVVNEDIENPIIQAAGTVGSDQEINGTNEKNGNAADSVTKEIDTPGQAGQEHVDDGHGNEENVESINLTGIELILENYFHIRKRHTTIKMEIYCGLIQFISCLYILPVVPQQMARAKYDEKPTIIATSAACAVGCIVASILTNLPFIIAPPTSVSIFLAVYLQQHDMGRLDGNAAVVVSGAALILIGIRPVGRFVARCIPSCIQASTSVGIGLITALAGAIEIGLVINGKYTILDMGDITDEIVIGMFGLVILAVLLHYHVKGAFCIALLVGTFITWASENHWPHSIVEFPDVEEDDLTQQEMTPLAVLLFFNLVFLYVLTLNGLARSLSDLAELTKPDGSIPHGRWLYIVCGFTTMLSGFMSGPPILISPESAAGIKAHAKTGLSTLICGFCFAIACFFGPLFAAVPAAGTAPLLLAVGVVLFGNVRRIDWSSIKEAVPAYCTLFFIPFTFSILRGVGFGYVFYLLLGLFTGDLYSQLIDFFKFYSESFKSTAIEIKPNKEGLSKIWNMVTTSMDIGQGDVHLSLDDFRKPDVDEDEDDGRAAEEEYDDFDNSSPPPGPAPPAPSNGTANGLSSNQSPSIHKNSTDNSSSPTHKDHGKSTSFSGTDRRNNLQRRSSSSAMMGPGGSGTGTGERRSSVSSSQGRERADSRNRSSSVTPGRDRSSSWGKGKKGGRGMLDEGIQFI